jgi:molybdopterin molybdotransferase
VSVRHDIGLEEALALTLAALAPLPPVEVPVHTAGGLVPARDVHAAVDCPTAAVSLKDGYAVRSADLAGATPERPVRLRLRGTAAAGGAASAPVEPGCAVRVLTGARLPAGADAVLAGEFAAEHDGDDGHHVTCRRDAAPGRNVLPRGSDVAAGDVVAPAGLPLAPARVGLLAAAGQATVAVHPRPRVAVVATGDEVVPPGQPLAPGQVYASNAVTLLAWLERFGMAGRFDVVPDDPDAIRRGLEQALDGSDAVLTSGGAWTSDRDHLTRVVGGLGARLLFHRVRIGPGKAVALGLLGRVPIFCLAGGPASNELGFLQLALPGLLRLSGRAPEPFPRRRAVLTEPVGGDPDWTQFVQVRLAWRRGRLHATPLGRGSRLQALAAAEGLVRVPEGIARLTAGEEAELQVLGPGAADPADSPLPPIVSVVGRTGAGKTALIEQLVPVLGRRGLRVGTLKHDVHGFELDHPGKDSYRHKHAGAHVSVISSPASVGLVRDVERDHPIAEVVARFLPDVDVVLTEGYAREAWPKVEVVAPGPPQPLLTTPQTGLVAVVGDGALDVPVPVFGWDRLAALADLLLPNR